MKLHIALVSEHASPLAALGGVDSGGQNVYVAQVARQLSRRGHRVDVYTRRDDDSLAETLHSPDGYRVVHVPAGPPRPVPKEELVPYMEEFADYMTRHVCLRTPDVIHANFFMSGLVGLRVKHRLGTPLVVTFHALGRVRLLHQGGVDRFPTERLEIEDELVAHADCVVAECPQDRSDLVSLYDGDPRRIRMAPCGYDPEELLPIRKFAARRALGLDPKTPIVLQLGRLVPRKGVDDAIRGFARAVQEHGAPARMIIAGGDSDRPDPTMTPEIGRLQQVALDEGVANRVTFAGRASRAQLPYFYSAANVFVTTPWYEPFGITPLESMACGTPVIGSAVGGIKFTVRDGRTGFLTPPHDYEAVGRRLAVLLADSNLNRQMSQESLRWVRERFTWCHVVDTLCGIYEQVVRRQRRRRTAWSAASKRSPEPREALAPTEGRER